MTAVEAVMISRRLDCSKVASSLVACSVGIEMLGPDADVAALIRFADVGRCTLKIRRLRTIRNS